MKGAHDKTDENKSQSDNESTNKVDNLEKIVRELKEEIRELTNLAMQLMTGK